MRRVGWGGIVGGEVYAVGFGGGGGLRRMAMLDVVVGRVDV